MDELVFILHHHVLFVINKAQITLNACEALKRALFVHVDPFVAPRLYDNDALPDLLRALNILLNVVADPNTNVIQSGELFRAGSDSIMDTLGDILMGSPVAYCGANRQQVENLMIAQPCWTLSLGLEGFDPSHDHTVPLCSLPASLFEAERLDSFDDELSPTSPSISDICDAKQTHCMFPHNSVVENLILMMVTLQTLSA